MRVTVVGGGVSSEHAVSLRSAEAVATALGALHGVDALTIEQDGAWSRDGVRLSMPEVVAALATTDVVFPALHGAGGEDGTIQGFLATLGVRFVGCGVEASAVCMRKDLTKHVLVAHGVEVVDGGMVATEQDARAALARLGTPVVVKPPADGSSVGVSVAHDVGELLDAIRERPMLVERYATGIEVDVAIVELDGERRVGTPLEIVRDEGGVFGLDAKYGGEPPFVVPARLSAAQRARVERASIEVFDALGCAGLARVDWFVDGDSLRCNEVNTMPGMTAASQLPRMLAHAGTPFVDLCDGLVRAAAG